MRSDSPSAPCRGGVVALCLAALAAAAIGCATPVSDDGGPIFYPLPPQRPRVQYLTRYVGATDLEGRPSALMRFLVGDVTSERKMRKPASVAAHDGVIYVADPGWETVLVLNLREGYFDGLKDRGEGKLQVPVAITIDEQGNKFVADTGRNQVVQFNPQNEFVRGYGNPATLIPSGVAVDKQHLYITDRREHQVLVLDRRTKKQLRVIGEFGPREGQFNIPTSLSVDERGHLFVTDVGNFRIQEFDADGNHVKTFGFLGDGPGTLARPKGTAVDREHHLFTVDAAFENVQIWDVSNAQVLLAFGGTGIGPGGMYLPASVHVNYEIAPYFEKYVAPGFTLEYVIFVANNYGPNRLAVYGFVTPTDPNRYEEFEPEENDESFDQGKE
ncbi:MAG: hypothetical protein JRH01_24195 [Deltaproteobacteria bacterium]|nr:hypothetical protein [Deltaproteobacteria bacterium]